MEMKFIKLWHFQYLVSLIFLSDVFFVFSSSSHSSSPHLCQDDQKSILLQFMNESFSEYYNPNKLVSWKPNTDCCSWEGVSCDNATGHVITLDLSNGDLEGNIHSLSSLFKLHTLLRLDLSGNGYLTFEFSSEDDEHRFGIARLSRMTYLNLSYIQLFGQVPHQMSSLTKLVSLDLSAGRKLKLESPNLERLIQNMSNLRVLYLDGIDMSTQSSNWCDALSSTVPNLVVLSLSYCSISGPIPSSLSNLHFLSEIDLSWNPLSSEFPEFLVNMSSLISIRLHDCGLHGEFPTNILRLPDVQEIDLSFNPDLRGPLPEFPYHCSLRKLKIGYSGFLGKLPKSMGNLESLTDLDLSGLDLSGPIPNSIGNLRNLQNLDLSSNNFTDSIPVSIGKLTQLKSLLLSFNHFQGSIPSSIGNLRKLENLDLSYNNFSGKIPDSIINLTKMYRLDLSYNHFSGSVPTLMLPSNSTSLLPDSGLLSLTRLDFSKNLLEGVINYSLFILPSLVYLKLQMNRFQALPAQVPCKPSPFLSTIRLRENILQGPIPGWITQLTNLSILDLSSNEFNGSMDMDLLSNLTNLEVLYLSDNHYWSITNGPNLSFPKLGVFRSHSCRVAEFPTFLRNTPALAFLDMSNNKIKGQIPSWIWTSSLHSLNLSLNLLTGLEEPFPNASTVLYMEILDLHSNQLQGSLPLMSQFVVYLDYSNNSFTSFFPEDIGSQISRAVFFSVSGNTLIGKIPTSICNVSELRVLDLSNNNLTGLIPGCIGNMSSSLSLINLGGNSLKGTMPQTYAASLATLVLNGNQLEGKVPSSLYGCQQLEVLDLGNNQIHDTFPFRLENLLQLRVLVLKSNRFYGQIKYSRTKNNVFPMLHVIDLSSNAFTGRLPSKYFQTLKAMMKEEGDKFGPHYLGVNWGGYYVFRTSMKVTMKGGEFQLERILDVFTSIDLANNHFEGKIPESIGEFKSLHVLDLSSNNLDGPIPSVMENLHQLESLALSNNKLSGEIPMGLAGLTFLSFLDLAGNNLEGPIPSGGQFNTFPPKSYEGNRLLCGFPLSKKCRAGEEAAKPWDEHQEVVVLDYSDPGTDEFEWRAAWMGCGCGVVAGLSIGYILFWGNGVFAGSISMKRHHAPSTRRRRERRTS